MGNLVRVSFPDGKIPPLTEAQIREAELAMERPINYDDIPPLSDAQLAKLRRADAYLAKLRRADEQIRNGQVVVKTMEELEAMAE